MSPLAKARATVQVGYQGEEPAPEAFLPWIDRASARMRRKSSQPQLDPKKDPKRRHSWRHLSKLANSYMDHLKCHIKRDVENILARIRLRHHTNPGINLDGNDIRSKSPHHPRDIFTCANGVTKDTKNQKLRHKPHLSDIALKHNDKSDYPFVYVPCIRVITPDGEVTQFKHWYHDMITASEAEQLQLSKMGFEQARQIIRAQFNQRMSENKGKERLMTTGSHFHP
jgi:hypothetical protein